MDVESATYTSERAARFRPGAARHRPRIPHPFPGGRF